MSTMALSIAACVASFCVLVWFLRRQNVSLGLPVAYLFGLLLIHVPARWLTAWSQHAARFESD